MHIRERCSNPRNKDFVNYGARGIVVCDRWRDSFSSFYADMGPRPSATHTIERVNNDGPYSPDNCAWVPRTLQNRNRRCVRQFTLNGVTRRLQDWAAIKGVSWKSLDTRLRRGWDVERALTTPPRHW